MAIKWEPKILIRLGLIIWAPSQFMKIDRLLFQKHFQKFYKKRIKIQSFIKSGSSGHVHLNMIKAMEQEQDRWNYLISKPAFGIRILTGSIT